MFQISNEVMEAFERAVILRFEERMIDHFREHAAHQCAALDRPQLHAVVRHGIQQAQQHGFETERDICLFITFLIFFGSAFEKDPLYPWIAEALQDSDRSQALTTLKHCFIAFYDRLVMYRDHRAFRQVAELTGNRVPTELIGHRTRDFTKDAMACMRALFEAKYALIEPTAFRAFVIQGAHSAAQNRIDRYDDVIDYLGLQFLLGFDFLSDPHFPWALEINSSLSLSASERIRYLYRHASAHYERIARN